MTAGSTPTAQGPLVTCLLPTADRRDLVPNAIRQFLEQDYPWRELLILDDGEDSVEDLVPNHPNIRYKRLSGRNTVGAKRNAGCREAQGELIAHWDDDDWMAPWRLSYQVEELLRFNVDICGLRQMYFWGPRPEQGWEYVYEATAQPWVAGGTMLYRKSLWETNPFEEVNVGEDNSFVWAAKRVLPLVDRRFYVATVHPRNTSPKLMQSERWRPVPLDEIQQVLGPDWANCAELIFGGMPNGAEQNDGDIEVSEDAPGKFAVARRAHLGLLEYAAINAGKSLPWMRRWELPFALFEAQLSPAMALLDCSINSAGLAQVIAELYPNALLRGANPMAGGKYLAPVIFPDAAFDRVFCLNTIEHFASPQREQLIAMAAAKLKPGGWLVATTDIYFESSWSKKEWLDTGLLRADREEVPNGFNRITPADLVALCARHGLQPLIPPPPEPQEGDAGLYLNPPPFAHAVAGSVFSKGAPAPPVRRTILLSLLTWNTMEPSLESLAAHVREARMLRRLGHDARICVVDNGSTDGTAEQLRNLEGKIDVPHRFILNGENLGNSRARNQIIAHLLETGADYVLFVDGDIEIVPFSSFVMLTHMESSGRSLGCFGAYSFTCTPERDKATPVLFSLAGCQIHTSDALAWTQYGIFRREMFEDGIRFDEEGPFGEPGHGLEDVDFAFQMNQLNYLNQYFSGICYLHRNMSSSVGLLSRQGLNPTERYYSRRDYVLQKWENVPEISAGPLNWVRRARAPWTESRTDRPGFVQLAPDTAPIPVPGAVLEWVDQSVSDMLDRTELMALAAVLATFDWRISDLVVEIGAYLGTTTVFMAKVLEILGRRPTILSIDPFERCQPDNLNPQGNYEQYIENIKANGVEDRCMALAAFSADAARTVPGGIGVLVIDGSHHYDVVKADLELYIPKVAPGGYVFLDDYGPAYPDVIRAIDEYLPAHPELEVVVKSYYVILRRGS